MKQAYKKITAWILTLVMAVSVFAVVPARQVKAAGDKINLISEEISGSGVKANTEGKYQVNFNNTSGYSSYSKLEAAGYTRMVVKLTCTDYTKAAAKDVAGVMSYYMHGSEYNWEVQWEELIKGTEITITQDLTKQGFSGDEVQGFGVLFDSLEPGSGLSFVISSAYLEKAGSSSGGSDSGETDWEINNDKITLSYTFEDQYNAFTEYKFYVNNDNETKVTGDLKITFASPVTKNWWTEDFNISASGNVLTVSGLNIEPNSSTSGIQVQLKPLGNTITSVSFAGETIGIGKSKSSGVELEYEMRGHQNKELSETPVGIHGSLSLANNKKYGNAPIIVDKAGNPFRMRGASMHGMHWFPEFVNKDAFQSLRDDFGVNMVRLVCYPKDIGGPNNYLDGAKDTLDTLIQKGVAYCDELGMYAMIDWHVHNWNPNDEIEAAKEFFTFYANKYKDHDNIIYEICNEPSGVEWYNGTSTDLYTYCSTIVSLIRSIDDDALIVCGTGFYSQWIDQVSTKRIDDNKVLYTLHFYSGTHTAGGLGATMESAIASGTPVFITEFGVCDASGNGTYNLEEADKWETLMEKYNISCACWSCSNKGESASYFKPGTSANGNWKAGDLTKTGGWLLNTYRKLEEEEGSNSPVVKPVDKYKVDLSKLSTEEAGQYVEAHNGSIEYDADAKILTLKEEKDYTITGDGADITVVNDKGTAVIMKSATVKSISTGSDLVICISGNNEIREGITYTNDGGNGLSVTIKAVNGDDDTLKVGSSLNVNNLTVESGQITVEGEGTAVITAKAKVAVKAGKLTVTIKETAAGGSTTGIKARETDISGGTVDVKGTGTAAGIEADNITISGGAVTAIAGNAAALTTGDADEGVVKLSGGVITVNNSSDTLKPIKSKKIIYDGAIVHSDSDTWYSTDPVDKLGNPVTYKKVTYIVDGQSTTSDVITGSTITLKTLEKKSGYKAMGWYKNEDTTTVLPEGKEETVSNDVTYTAYYLQITGKLEFGTPSTTEPLKEGYSDNGIAVSVTNNTNVSVDKITISLRGDDSDSYSLSDSVINELESGKAKVITLKLKDGLSAKAAGYKTTVVISDNDHNTSAELEITRKVYLSDEDSLKVDVSRLDEPGYVEIHNGRISVEKTTNEKGESVNVLNLEESTTYTITGTNNAVIVKAKKEATTVNLDNATVKDVKGTSNYKLNGNSKIISPTTAASLTPIAEAAVVADNIELTAALKGISDYPVKSSFKLAVKKSMQLNVRFMPENAEPQDITYTNSNSKVAEITETGKITAKKAGKTVITVTTAGGLTKAFKLTVMKKPVKRIKLKASKKTLKVNKTLKLKASVTPGKKKASNTVLFKSGNEEIATVDSKGVVRGVNKGKVKITAIATDGSGKKAVIKLTVK